MSIGEKLQRRLEEVTAERDSLAAHVERIIKAWNAEQNGRELFEDAWINYVGDTIEDSPTTSLARLKAEWQAEALEEFAIERLKGFEEEQAKRRANQLRRQAEADQ